MMEGPRLVIADEPTPGLTLRLPFRSWDISGKWQIRGWVCL